MYCNDAQDKDNLNPFVGVVANDGSNLTVYKQGQISICGEYTEYDVCSILHLAKEFVSGKEIDSNEQL